MNEPDDGGLPDFAAASVTIVGLGLMGGSLGLALKQRCSVGRVWGVNRRATVIERAIELGAVDGGTTDAAEGVADADIVVLATPVQTIVKLLGEIGDHLKPGCLVLDMGSTKSAIVDAMAALPDHVEPVGGHPMCGKEVAGILAAEASLYEGAVFVLTPLARTSRQALADARRLAANVGATPLVLDAARHDRLVAAVSHLPYLAAVTLVAAASQVAAEDALAWPLAASGFRDTSRLAASDVTMMYDILATNRDYVGEMLRRYKGELDQVIDLLEREQDDELRSVLERAWQNRHGVVP